MCYSPTPYKIPLEESEVMMGMKFSEFLSKFSDSGFIRVHLFMFGIFFTAEGSKNYFLDALELQDFEVEYSFPVKGTFGDCCSVSLKCSAGGMLTS